jgi:hypothetical protein
LFSFHPLGVLCRADAFIRQPARVRGWKWLINDLVNLACAARGEVIGIFL